MKAHDKTRAPSVSSKRDAADRRAASYVKLTGGDVLCRTLIDSLTDYAMFAVAPSGDIVSWNAGAQQTFGYMRSEMIGQSFSIIFTAEDVEAGAPQLELRSALSGEQTQHDRWHVRKNKSRFWGTNAVRPFYDASDALLGFTKLVRDITSSRALSDTIVDLAHSLSIVAIAEGIETDDQLRALVEVGCDLGQDFLFSAPVNPGAAAGFLKSGVAASVTSLQQANVRPPG